HAILYHDDGVTEMVTLTAAQAAPLPASVERIDWYVVAQDLPARVVLMEAPGAVNPHAALPSLAWRADAVLLVLPASALESDEPVVLDEVMSVSVPLYGVVTHLEAVPAETWPALLA